MEVKGIKLETRHLVQSYVKLKKPTICVFEPHLYVAESTGVKLCSNYSSFTSCNHIPDHSSSILYLYIREGREQRFNRLRHNRLSLLNTCRLLGLILFTHWQTKKRKRFSRFPVFFLLVLCRWMPIHAEAFTHIFQTHFNCTVFVCSYWFTWVISAATPATWHSNMSVTGLIM